MVVDVEELVESDKEIVEDKRTMIELKKIANTIYDCTMVYGAFTIHNRLCIRDHQEGELPCQCWKSWLCIYIVSIETPLCRNWNDFNVEIISILKMKLFHVEAISFKSWLLTSSFQAFNLLQIILKRQRLNAIDARCCTKDSITRLLNRVKRNS